MANIGKAGSTLTGYRYICTMEFPSVLIQHAVNAFASLPGVGRKTALRMVLHLLKKDIIEVEAFAGAISDMRKQIKFCIRCHNISDDDVCSICSNSSRHQKIICVVENFKDVIAIENTQQYKGIYHVLGGLISPLDGIGPDQLKIESLVNRISTSGVEELIFALNPTIQGDTTIYYVKKKIADFSCRITTIARGISFGGDLEYADEITLARSLQNRLPVEKYVS
jgi:recombination protein RecR